MPFRYCLLEKAFTRNKCGKSRLLKKLRAIFHYTNTDFCHRAKTQRTQVRAQSSNSCYCRMKDPKGMED